MHPRNTEPTHSAELADIAQCLTAAKLALIGITPPQGYELTPALIEQAQKACDQIWQCKRRVLWDR